MYSDRFSSEGNALLLPSAGTSCLCLGLVFLEVYIFLCGNDWFGNRFKKNTLKRLCGASIKLLI